MQPGQLEKLKQLIAASPLLEQVERAHWLELLPLMNDKQITDLEGILQPQKNGTVVSSLSHLANVPSHINSLAPAAERQGQPAPVPPRIFAKLPIDITEKELPPGPSVHEDHMLATVAPHVVAPKVIPPKVIPPKIVPPYLTPPLPQAKKPVEYPAPGTAPNSFLTPADILKVTAGTLHQLGIQRLTQALQDLVRKTNYFAVLFALEKSPLFLDYIRTGQTMLEENSALDKQNIPAKQGRNPPDGLLAREDFEAVADLLRNIQIN
jgi:hypothetical protein